MVLKGAIPDLFFSFLSAPRTVFDHVRSSGQDSVMCKSRANASGAYHVQRVVRHVVPRGGTAFKSDRVEIAFNLLSFRWLKPYTAEGGEKTGVLRENTRRRASQNATY